MYKNYLERLSKEAKTLFDAILAEYNFDYGDEFEIALCKFLRLTLPQKFSICRGFVVSKDNQYAGDDVIIYDSSLFPKIRLVDNDLSIKQYIPIEAVYAYIEAKHTLYIDDIDKDKGQSLKKACEQVGKVKELVLRREKRLLNSLPGLEIGAALQVNGVDGWPNYRNPIFGCVISRKIHSACAINENSFAESFDKAKINIKNLPDLIIAGDSIIGLPVISKENNNLIESPFFIENRSLFAIFENNKNIACGLMNLLLALNFIILKEMNYKALLAEGLGINMRN